MTDTIGWGDVDVDEAPHRRRVSRRLVWPALGVVVAGVALTPTARHHFADGAASRLQQQWATAKALDASRQSIEQSTLLLLGVGDGPRFARIVQALDHSEASQLSRLASQIGHDRTWSGDLHRAAVAARHALAAQVHDLVADAAHAPAVIGFTMYPSAAASPTTERIVDSADAAVTAAARRHHVAPARASSARLTPPSALLAPLSRVTDSPVDAELAVMHDNSLDIWDLHASRRIRTIRVPRLDTGDAPDNNDDGPLVVVGSSVLQGAFGQLRLLPLDGRPPVRLGMADTLSYLPAGTSGLWAVTGDRARRYDTDGRPVGPARPLPDGTQAGGAMTATTDAIVLAITTGSETAEFVVWFPESGRRLTLAGSCGGAAGSRRTVFFTDCTQRSVRALDVDTGRIRRLRLPGNVLADGIFVPSPDGSRVALSVLPSGAETPDQERLAIADFASGTVTVLPRAANPIGWSANGSVLLAQPQDVSTVVRLAPLGYWIAGMRDLAAVRIDVGGARFSATLL